MWPCVAEFVDGDYVSVFDGSDFKAGCDYVASWSWLGSGAVLLLAVFGLRGGVFVHWLLGESRGLNELKLELVNFYFV